MVARESTSAALPNLRQTVPGGAMLRKLVRFYYRLRYLPRHIFSAFTDIDSGVSRVGGTVSGLADDVGALREEVVCLGTDLGKLHADVATLGRNLGELHDGAAWLGRNLGDLREDIGSFKQSVSHTFAEMVQEMGEFRDSASIALLSVHRRAAATDEAVARLGNEIRREADITARLDQFLRLQARVIPTSIWTPAAAAEVRSILSLLRPWAAQGVAKVRVGRDCDGGYVMLDDFIGITRALSLGVSDDVSWDSAIAERGIPVLQFDQTVAAPPVAHPLFGFERLRIAPFDDVGAVSVGSILRTRVPETGDTLLLKMDIEGAEWEVCVGLADDVLRRFRQIVCEFHELDRLAEAAFRERARRAFERLSRTHFVCHVHGNNCASFANVANVPVPQSLEVTFASRACYIPEPTAETFPTSLDRPNEPDRADLYLGHFRFDVA